MSDFLSSLIGRSKQPKTDIKPRLGSLFEPSPMLGAPAAIPWPLVGEEHTQAADSPARSPVVPPPPVMPVTRSTSPAPGASPAPRAKTRSEGSQPATGQPGLSGQTAGNREDTSETHRQAQRIARTIRPPDDRSTTTVPPVAPIDDGPRTSRDPQIRPRAIAPPNQPQPPPALLPHEHPATESRSLGQSQSVEPRTGRVPDWMARLASTVAPPMPQETPRQAEVRPPAQRDAPDAATTIRPTRRGPVGPEAAGLPPVIPAGGVAGRPAVPTQPSPPDPPVIRVTIGRIEVRANLPEAPRPRPPARQPVRSQPALSLSDYLKQRGGRP